MTKCYSVLLFTMYWKCFLVITLSITLLAEIKCRVKNIADFYDIDESGDLGYGNDYDEDYDFDIEREEYLFNSEDEEGDFDDDYEPINLLSVNKKNLKKSNPKLLSKSVNPKIKTSNRLKNHDDLQIIKEHEDDYTKENTKMKSSEFDIHKIKYISSSDETVCSLKLNYDISKKNEPLFLLKDSSDDFQLAFPDLVTKQADKYNSAIGAIQFGTKHPIFIACPGKNNAIKGSDSNDHSLSEMKCINGSRVSLHTGKVDKLTDSSQLTCLKPAAGAAIFSEGKTPCGNEGVLLELGFKVEGWHKLIDVCFNVKKVKTLYVKHKLYGSVLAGAVIDSNRPKFNKGQDDFYKGFNPDDYYKKANEKETILELTGDEKYFKPDSNLYLARGHFAPDADFIFKAWQDLTYFYVNVAPQWQSINQGHWLSVERLARNIAMKLGEDLDIITGPYGIMKISGRELYLKINRKKTQRNKNKEAIPELAVPDYYWKLIHRPKKNECIVLISTNNPFLDKPKNFCKDICEEHLWPTLKDAKKGFVSCCSYDNFVATIKNIPKYNCSGGILKGP